MIRLKITTMAMLLDKITKIYQDNIWKIYEVSKNSVTKNYYNLNSNARVKVEPFIS